MRGDGEGVITGAVRGEGEGGHHMGGEGGLS